MSLSRFILIILLIVSFLGGCSTEKPYADILNSSQTKKVEKRNLPPGISASDAPTSNPYVEPPAKPPE